MNRRLYRSADDRVFAGVAGGMAETYDMDPALVRIAWVVLAILTGIFPLLLVYIVIALVVPLAPDDRPYAPGYAGPASGPVPGWPGTGSPPDSPPPPQSPEGDLTATGGLPGAPPDDTTQAPMPFTPPYMSERERRRQARLERRGRGGDMTAPLIFGLLLVLVGGFFLFREWFPGLLPAIAWGQVWPIALIAVGALLLLAALRRRS